MKREAGILLPISSLPSKYGIGCFSKEAYSFVDFLKDSGQSLWQILPLCPTSYGDSPYQSPCSFAGNPYFICPDSLMREGLLTEEEIAHFSAEGDREHIDYGELYNKRFPLLRLAYDRFKRIGTSDSYASFLTENSEWLYDYALYMAIKTHFGGAPLSEWSEGLKSRKPSVMAEYRRKLSDEIGFWQFLQFKFFTQWHSLKNYANGKGIKIIGDIPIYVSADSCEVWTTPELFELDSDLKPLSVAGCPPDGFSPAGQLWGNPIYDWQNHRKNGFSWWRRRIAHAFQMYDVVRIDHFRGFHSYYSIPYGAPDATGGHWERGVGKELFSEVERAIGKKEIIAEDLGYITEGVRRLVRDCGFSGMKIVQFGFDSGDFNSEYLPCNYGSKSVVYTGTHDNPTLYEWLSTLSEKSEEMLRSYLCDTVSPLLALGDKIIALAMQSPCELCIIPMQDYLGIGREGRLNTPSSASGNWTWRIKDEEIKAERAQKIKLLTEIGGRLKNC